MKYSFTNRVDGGLGFEYRQTPLNSNFSGSGNSIDANTYVFSAGFNYRIVIWSKDVSIGSSLEYHLLQTENVTKSTNDELGNAGSKIGAPGYTIGGHLISAAAGLKFNF